MGGNPCGWAEWEIDEAAEEISVGALANTYRVDGHGKPIKGAIQSAVPERELKPHRSTEKAAGGKVATSKVDDPVDGDKALRVEIARLGLAVTTQAAEISKLRAENASFRDQLVTAGLIPVQAYQYGFTDSEGRVLQVVAARNAASDMTISVDGGPKRRVRPVAVKRRKRK